MKRFFVLMLAVLPCVAVLAQDPAPKVRPAVNGAVFGGGRMADVNGSTVITVVNCDTIGAVFGGNDIAGTVGGANGSTITIGTLTGNARGETTDRLSIGSVYGGGNGYYEYDGNKPGPTVGVSILTGRTFSSSVTDVDGSVVYTVSGTIPSIAKTAITVNTDHSCIDSLFGGARNAFVTNTSDNSTQITINGGTIYSVFGGNNHGGTLGTGSTQYITVANTKKNNESSVNLGGFYQTGHAWTSNESEHGIRYLFGGGNKAAAQNVHIVVNGGQIDTLFGGGNSADVGTTVVDVNVTTPLYTLATSPYTDATTYAYSTITSVFDIRCLFGGNNAADMSGLPTLNLTKGGIHNVYGGGNKGVMLAANSYTDNYAIESITPTNNTNHKEGATRSTNVVVNSEYIIIDTIYGGGQSAGTLHDTYVEIADGNVGVVYGGTNIMGRIGPDVHTGLAAPRDLAKTNVYIHGGTVHNTVFGASNGYYRCHNGLTYSAGDNILFADANAYSNLVGKYTPSVFNSYVLITDGNIKGNVYSSGNMAAVGKPTALDGGSQDSAGIALLHIIGGTIGVGSVTAGVATITQEGNVFGGGNMGCVYGASDLVISNSPIIYGNVYGGNDKTGRVFATLRASNLSELHNTSSAATAAVSASEYPGVHTTDLAIGGTIPLAQNNASTYTLITGTPKIYGSVFGGGNGDYIYVSSYSAKQTQVNAGKAPEKVVIDCSQTPSADQRSSFVDINLANTGYVNRVFGGGNSKTTGYAQREGGSGTITEQGESYVFLNCTTAPADNNDNINVGTIFGGNNNVPMNSVPRIAMLQGKVGNVYGGGNLGAMTGEWILAGLGLSLSTYVATPSDNVVVTGNIYGGCNVADVTNDTYVKITQGIVRGDIFGGNDLSGEVGISHVIIDGDDGKDLLIRGNVYGGGNGNYPFYAEDGSSPVTYTTTTNGVTYTGMSGRPYVDSAAVVLNGEFTINGNVYGGGISGDCRKTNVLVDADEGVFNGLIFGAGRGRVDNMGLRINGTCKAYYIGVAQDANGDGITDRDGNGDIIYGTGNAMGNVLDTAWLTVRQFKSMASDPNRSAMFGGGQSGNVRNTMLTYENTAVNPLDALYLGCLASDVTGTATGVIDAYEPTNGHWIIDTIYGGNDFTGRVEHTNMIVNSGIFTHLFGAGNGDYNYDQWIANRTDLADDAETLALGGCADTVPYTMDVNVTINGGEFLNTVYGGGNMGLVGDRDMVADSMTSAKDNRAHYIGTITLNVHDGVFHRHLFTGARGKTDMEGSRFFNYTANGVDGQVLGKQLAYAQKILNMDGGHVMFSVYGGSEAVDDGFPYECIGAENNAANPLVNTTLRPSTIMNITGGRVEKSVYGGGYQGNIYGSVYVNIGIDAVRDCPAWTQSFGNFNVADYRPNLLDHSGYDITNTLDGSNNVVKARVARFTSTIPGNPTLSKNVIDLETSVYNASDWGEAGTNAYFLTRGVFGGVTNILIDGRGYNTSLNPLSVGQPAMNINYSIIGAGTSTEGGDVNRLITMRHYGDYTCPNPSKTLYSIQRADKVVLDSVFIDLYGEQDAFSAYASPSYSFCRIDTLIFRVDNVVMIESPAIFIGNWASMKTDNVKNISNPLHLFDNGVVAQEQITAEAFSTVPNDFFDNLYPQVDNQNCTADQCEQVGICLRLPNLRGTEGNSVARNVVMIRNGSYIKVYPFIDEHNNTTTSTLIPDGLDDGNHSFGHVYGWMYLMAQDATKSYVYADTKVTTEYADAQHSVKNEGDGGFISTCRCDNFTGTYQNEIDYTNVQVTGNDEYRSWTVGFNQGSRVRHITLVANATPDGRLNSNLTEANYPLFIKDDDTQSGTVTIQNSDDYAYATTVLELPPADGGNFYVINSVLIDQDNGGQLNLVDQAYENKGNIFFQTSDNATNLLPSIANDPDYTFGLAFANDENFDTINCWNQASPAPSFYSVEAPGVQFTRNLTDDGTAAGQRYACWKKSVISGNQYITNQGGYISNAIIGGAVGAIPTMKFTLTYNKNIHTTITRDVIFTMFEFDDTGGFVGPVEVTVTISTVIKEFSDLEAPVLAMFNEGISDEYVRKITIPASFQQRHIYITGIEWMKDTLSNTGTVDNPMTVYSDPNKEIWFNLEEYTGTAPGNNNHFSVIVKPTEATSENINNTLGWYHIAHPEGIDVYKLAKDDYKETTGLDDFSTDDNNHRRDSIYRSWDYNFAHRDSHYDPAVTPKETKMGTEGNGYWLGTLDGRSTASIDVSLKFNGLWYYHPQFDPPLAWVRLRCKYYNTKTVTPDDNEFWIYIKIRTRLEGDTIYMAPGKTLTRTAVSPSGSQELKMHAYGYGYNESDPTNYPPTWEPSANATPNYGDIGDDKVYIKNNPNNYLQDFKQVMMIYQEGDVIDIMETIPIYKGDEPTTVKGGDYSIVQIIRYSGSHYKFPTMACANYNPLVEIKGSGRLTMRNVWFNGSGCTRTKPAGAGTEEYTTVGTHSYYKEKARVNTLLYANSPMVYIHEHGEAAFTKNVIFSNNFNQSYDRNPNTDVVNNNFIGGGAIALVNDNPLDANGNHTGSAPTVTLGDMDHIYDNVVIDWNATTTGGTSDWLPRNYGGGVYVNGGQFIIGGGYKGTLINIDRNFYMKKSAGDDDFGVRTKTAHMFNDQSDNVQIDFNVYFLDTTNYAQTFSLSNVYLTRKGTVCDNTDDDTDNPVSLTRLDKQSDVVYFLSEMSPESRIGISKWFPGYVYNNSRISGTHFLNEETPRDTVSIARIGRGKSSTSMVDNNYSANVFFNDSAFVSIDNRTPEIVSTTDPSFTSSYPAVTYSGNTTAYPDYKDKVFIFRHTSLSPYTIYFQRCASFGKGVIQLEETGDCFNTAQLNAQGVRFNTYQKGDSISYHWNSTATCALAMDTLRFRVGGGFFPYTYKWYDVSDTTYDAVDPSIFTVDRRDLHTRVTTGSNAISRFGVTEYARLRKLAEFDTLVFRTEVTTSGNRHNYAFQVVATDLTGNCPVTQDVKVRAVKISTDHHDNGAFIYDYANFLQHRKNGALSGTDTADQSAVEAFYRIKSPGVDSSSFHDHVGFTPRHDILTDDELSDGIDDAEQGGLRRAGYTHTADSNGYNDNMSGKPYVGNGYYAGVGDMTPRYLRVFRSYTVKPSIYPVAARGEIEVRNYLGETIETIDNSEMSDDDWSPEFEVCPGEVLNLTPTTESDHVWEFIGWDFNPSAPEVTNFVVGNDVASNKPIIYYVPGDYWWQYVTTQPAGYELDYYGNVTITSKEGLAWLISTVNGYNGQNAQTFHFNTITLNPSDGKPFDMSAHKWTPLGNANNPFEGVFDGNGKHVTNILVNETTIPLVGMFGQTRGATIKNFIVDSTMVRGNSYVSAIVGEAMDSTVIDNVTIQRGAIFGEHTIGGFISHMVNSTLKNSQLTTAVSGGAEGEGKIGAYGNAVYAGGFVGFCEGEDSIINISTQNRGYIDISKLSAVYVGAYVGHSDGDIVLQKNGKSNGRTVLNNNYARLLTSSSSQRVGGLIGYAKDIEMNNNYVYGIADYDKQFGFSGGIAGYIDNNVRISNCYYVDGMADNMVGFNMGSMPQKSTTFNGRGNNVVLTQPVDGYTNLTRALNAWVRDNDSDGIYETWRSDLENVNNGYPIFGEPDIIPVKDTILTASCESFEFDGLTFDQSGTYIFHFVDSADFVDSTLTLMLTINYGDTTQVSDTVEFGNGYEGNGFSLTSEELRTSLGMQRVNSVYVLHFIDSLQNANGCDSLVVLTLYVLNNNLDVPEVQKLVDVKVYPNPTRSIVNVEGSDLQKVEVYDNVSRRILSKSVDGDRTSFDLSNQAAGSYYVRISTAHGTVVKKVIKK